MDKRVAKHDEKKSAPKNETQNLPQPLPSPWSTSTQVYHNFGPAATSSVNSASSLFHSPWFGSQIWHMPIPYDSVHQRRSFSNLYPMATAGFGQSSLLVSVDGSIQRASTELNNNLMGKGLQSQESRPSILKTNGEGLTRSATSKSRETTVVGHDVKNAGGATKFKIKDLPSVKPQQSSMMPLPGNGGGVQNVISNENCNAVHENRNIASDHFEANPTELNQKLTTAPNATGNNPHLKEKESDETKEKRKRQENKISAKRTKRKIMKLQDIPSTRQGHSSMMHGNGGASQNVTSNETCNAVHENRNIASDHFEANPTELQNQKLGTEPNASGNKRQLRKKETAEEKEQRRKQQKKIASKRSRMKIKMEREKLIDSLESLDDEKAALREELHDRTIECEKIEKENNALLAELIEEYGEETIMNLLNAQSTDSVAGGGQGSKNS
ncbi:G-box-binding factor 1 [Glycine soja]